MGILIIGGTGTVGREVVSRLVERGEPVAVLTRSSERLISLPPGVQGRLGDVSKPDALMRALEGTDRLILITAMNQSEAQQGIAAVEAAKRAGVSHVAFLSVHKVESGPHIPMFKAKMEIQKAIESSGMKFTFLMPNNFFQNDYSFERPIMDYGVYPQPLGDVGLHRVDVRDIADAFMNVITEPGHAGMRYPLVGPEAWTGKKIAEVYSRHLWKQVRYGGSNLNAWAEQASQILPPWMVRDLKVMFEFVQLKGLLATEEDFQQQEKILKHPPRSFEDFVQETVSRWQK